MQPTPLAELLTGTRIVLKRHSPDRASAMFAAIDRDRERLRRFLPWVDPTRSESDTVRYIESAIQKWNDHSGFDYAIFLKESDTYLGNVGVQSISWPNDRCELGYWILGPYEGQGFVSETVELLERTLFEHGFHRIEIRCSSLNSRSANIPQRLGYHLDGTLRDDSVEHGKRRSTLVFTKLKSQSPSERPR